MPEEIKRFWANLRKLSLISIVILAFANSDPFKIKSPPPNVGETLVMDGVLYENVVDEAASCVPIFIFTGRFPPLPIGVIAAISLAEIQVILVHDWPFIVSEMIEDSLPKFVPVKVVNISPREVLGFGDMCVMVGGEYENNFATCCVFDLPFAAVTLIT